MNINFLLEASTIFNSFGVDTVEAVPLEWVANIISWIFDLFTDFHGAVAVGVIVFTLCLKTLVLPLDIFSRVKMRKQSLLMKRMRPQMEKLQKQYANDSAMYQMKVRELQKANGFNPIAACLPTIISLIIFMFIFSSFSTYSNYATLANYNEMVKAYNETVTEYVVSSEEEVGGKKFLIGENNDYRVDFGVFADYYATQNEDFGEEEVKAFKANPDENEKWEVVINYIRGEARGAVAFWYENNNEETKFGWISNLWYPDSMLNNAVPSYDNFVSSVSRATVQGQANYEDDYNEVTYNLSELKSAPNGYFVLIILAIGLMFLQQFIMMRAQKDANELTTVDGSGAVNNKWMMIIMPIIFGFFSFMYSAAFSIYMITNTLYGLISTLIINKIVTARFDKLEENKNTGRPSGRNKR